jgi:hypothetical protein
MAGYSGGEDRLSLIREQIGLLVASPYPLGQKKTIYDGKGLVS